jgi:hypothetical protein
MKNRSENSSDQPEYYVSSCANGAKFDDSWQGLEIEMFSKPQRRPLKKFVGNSDFPDCAI